MISINDIFKKLSQKAGKEIHFEDLNAEEKAVYAQWEQVLKEEITIDKIRNFLRTEVNRIDMEWSIPDLSQQKDTYLKAEMRILKTLLAFIEAPIRSKEFLENHLNNLFGSK